MPALSTVLLPDVLRSIDTSTFTGSFQAVGNGLAYGARIVKFTNASTVGVTISWDGVNAADYLPPNSFLLLDVTAAKENSLVMEIQIGTQFYAEGSAGVGLLYISVYYGR